MNYLKYHHLRQHWLKIETSGFAIYVALIQMLQKIYDSDNWTSVVKHSKFVRPCKPPTSLGGPFVLEALQQQESVDERTFDQERR